MAKKPNDIAIIQRFVDSYLDRLNGNNNASPDSNGHHKSNGQEKEEITDLGRLIMNLIADDISDLERIRNYMIIEEYYSLLRENNGISYITLIELSDKYDLSERQIQNIVYKWSDKYKKVSNVAVD